MNRRSVLPFTRALCLSLTMTVLIFAFAPVALAQYSVPDCMIAGLNALMDNADYYEGRDISYKELSADWSAYVAQLTPAQLKGYSEYVCAHLTVVDLGKDEEQTWHWRVDYPPIEDYLATVGQRPGQNPPTTNPSGNKDDVSGKVGSKVQPAAGVEPLGKLLFQTEFDGVSRPLELTDDNGKALKGSVETEDGGQFLHIQSSQPRTLFLSSASDWTDYTVEARVRLKQGTLAVIARLADDRCAGYSARFKPLDDTVQLFSTNADCVDKPLHVATTVGLNSDQWMTLRFDVNGDQLSASIDGVTIFTETDSTYASGAPALRLLPNAGATAVLDVDSLRVTGHISGLNGSNDALTQYAAASSAAIAELQTRGVIPSGGTLIFTEPQVYFNGSGRWFQPLATGASKTDIVMAGSLTLREGGGLFSIEECALMARISGSGDAQNQLEIGFDSTGALYVRDLPDQPDGPEIYHTTLSSRYPDGETYHLLVTLFGSQLIAYVDGQPALSADDIGVRAGYYGLGLTGKGPKARCEGRNVWVYGFK